MLTKKNKVLLVFSIVSFVLFGALIVLLCTVDRQSAGQSGAAVGLAGINSYFFDNLGQSTLWYDLTEALGLIAFAAVGGIGLVALVQLCQRKSLWKLDVDLWLTAAFLAIMAAFYLLFEQVTVNCRPVLEEGNLAASFPSSHTLLIGCVMWAAAAECHRRIPYRSIRLAAVIVCVAMILLTVVGRLLSGVHWFTDILGSALLITALGCLYMVLCSVLEKRNTK